MRKTVIKRLGSRSDAKIAHKRQKCVTDQLTDIAGWGGGLGVTLIVEESFRSIISPISFII